LAGLTQEQMSADEDHKLLKHGIGFTNMVARATKGSADLTRKEIKEGSRILLEKLQRFRPKVAVFNGKLIFEVFSGKKEFHFGRQPDRVDGTDTVSVVFALSFLICSQMGYDRTDILRPRVPFQIFHSRNDCDHSSGTTDATVKIYIFHSFGVF